MSLSPSAPRKNLLWPDIIEQLGHAISDPGDLYLVGGVVRDALRGRPLHDIDLTTSGSGLRTARQIANALDGAYYPVDPERETGRAILPTPEGGLIIDVATFRGADLLDDLQGRDFTINAMAVPFNLLDQIIDPLAGQEDLFDHRVLRQCNPDSIASDPIRGLRAVRLGLELNLRMLPETREAARNASRFLQTTQGALAQPERVRDEMFKILEGQRPASALRLLHSLGLLAAVVPSPLEDALLEQQFALVENTHALLSIISPQRNDNTAADLIMGVAVIVLDRFRKQLQDHLWQQVAVNRTRAQLLLLAALTPPAVANASSWTDHWRLSNAEKRILEGAFASRKAGFPPTGWDEDRDLSIHRYYRAAGESGVEGVLLGLASFLTEQSFQTSPQSWGSRLDEVASPLLDAYFRRHQEVIAPPPLLTGVEIMQAMNLEPGPAIGAIMSRLLEEQAAGRVRNKQEALRLTKRLLQGGS